MTESVKATRSSVRIGSLEVDGFMLPDGSYRMSQTQAAECIGKPEINARRFLDSKAIKALLGNSYTPDTVEIEASAEQLRGQSRFNALPLEVVTAYWFNQRFIPRRVSKINRISISINIGIFTNRTTQMSSKSILRDKPT